MDEEVGKSSFLDANKFPIRGLSPKRVEVVEAPHCGCNKPWETKDGVNAYHEANDQSVVVVGDAMF